MSVRVAHDAGPWAGGWVAERLGIALSTAHAPVGVDLADLLGLAVRHNPRRAHLLVSTVLGKHVPTDPRIVEAAGQLLGALVADQLAGGSPGSGAGPMPGAGSTSGAALVSGVALKSGVGPTSGPVLLAALAGEPGAARTLADHAEAVAVQAAERRVAAPDDAVVLGFAETATALGHAVADTLVAPFLHSTRREVPGSDPLAVFEEPHSHATSHLLLPEDPAVFTGAGPLVLVDDELSTGRTALNTIEALHRIAPRDRYVVAALVDLRSAADRQRWLQVAGGLGARIDVVALAGGTVELPEGVLEAGVRLVETQVAARQATGEVRSPGPSAGSAPIVELGHAGWPVGVREGARHGSMPQDRAGTTVAAGAVADAVARRLPGPDRRVLVLGFEELMHAPLRIAVRLAQLVELAGTQVRFSTTTRSPVLAVDAVDYAIRTALAFGSHDAPSDGPGPRFAYNVAPGSDPTRRFTDIVLVLDDAADTPELRSPEGLLAQLAAHCDQLVVVTLPVALPVTVP